MNYNLWIHWGLPCACYDRIMDQYQKQDEVHMRTSSWGKARRLRDEIAGIIKSE